MTITRTFQTLLLSSLAILFIHCDNNDKDEKNKNNFIFSASELKQTWWKGKIIFISKELVTHGYINIEFTTENRGFCESKMDNQKYPDEHSFNYKIEDKLMHIDGTVLTSGDWILQKYDGDSLVIVRNYVSESIRTFMKLKKFE